MSSPAKYPFTTSPRCADLTLMCTRRSVVVAHTTTLITFVDDDIMYVFWGWFSKQSVTDSHSPHSPHAIRIKLAGTDLYWTLVNDTLGAKVII